MRSNFDALLAIDHDLSELLEVKLELAGSLKILVKLEIELFLELFHFCCDFG